MDPNSRWTRDLGELSGEDDEEESVDRSVEFPLRLAGDSGEPSDAGGDQ